MMNLDFQEEGFSYEFAACSKMSDGEGFLTVTKNPMTFMRVNDLGTGD